MQPLFGRRLATIGLCAMAASAEAAPQQLTNKTISVAFSGLFVAKKMITPNRKKTKPPMMRMDFFMSISLTSENTKGKAL